MTDRTIPEYMSELSQMINASSQNYSAWRALVIKESREKYSETMNLYPSFFGSAINAHFLATIIPLYTMYENKRDRYNFFHLIEMVKAEDKIDVKSIDKLNELISRAMDIWKKISVLRNRGFAHRSKAHTIKEVFSIAGITPDEINEMIEVSKKIMNVVAHAWDGSVYAFNLSNSPAEDLVAILDVLTERRLSSHP